MCRSPEHFSTYGTGFVNAKAQRQKGRKEYLYWYAQSEMSLAESAALSGRNKPEL
jgi:hypothetical protein